MRRVDEVVWCLVAMVTCVVLAMALSSCSIFTSPSREGETFYACGDYPGVYVAQWFSAGQAEDFYDETIRPLTTGPTGQRLLRDMAASDKRITFFRPGEPITYVRRSTRYDELVQVRTETDQLVTLRDELQGLVGPC